MKPRSRLALIGKLCMTRLSFVGRNIGLILLKLSSRGSMLGVGGKLQDREEERFYVVIATRDVADRLRDWYAKEHDDLVEAVEHSGLDAFTEADEFFVGLDDNEQPGT
jgi:hypothetical protein